MRLNVGSFASCQKRQVLQVIKVGAAGYQKRRENLSTVVHARPFPRCSPFCGRIGQGARLVFALCIRIDPRPCANVPRVRRVQRDVGYVVHGGESTHLHVARAHAPRPLLRPCPPVPPRVTRLLLRWTSGRYLIWMSNVISAGLRVRFTLIVAGRRVDPAATLPVVGPWSFNVELNDAAGLPASGVELKRRTVS